LPNIVFELARELVYRTAEPPEDMDIVLLGCVEAGEAVDERDGTLKVLWPSVSVDERDGTLKVLQPSVLTGVKLRDLPEKLASDGVVLRDPAY